MSLSLFSLPFGTVEREAEKGRLRCGGTFDSVTKELTHLSGILFFIAPFFLSSFYICF